MRFWGIKHHQTAAYHPHSNLQAEVGVKSVKKIVSENVGANGSLDTNQFSLALVQYINMPLRDLDQSPAEILFCRQLKDGLPCDPLKLEMNPNWIKSVEQREAELFSRYAKSGKIWARESKQKAELKAGQSVLVQIQAGAQKGKWLQSGTIIDGVGHNSYHVKIDGSGRISKRRRQFLKPIGMGVGTHSARNTETVENIYNLRHRKP